MNTELFVARLTEIADIYKGAFGGYPWFEELSYDVVNQRLKKDISREGFRGFVAEDETNTIVGCLWFDTPTLNTLESERGLALRQFAENKIKETGIENLIWEREVMTDPKHQKKGIATQLRTAFLGYIGGEYPEGAIILTRMRDDNTGIITIAQKLGFMRTGIKIPSSQNAEVKHEYWHNLIT